MSAVAYLVLSNPSAKNNLGTLIRCAAAFAVEEVIIVGATKWSTHGAHGSHKHVRYRCFDDWGAAAAFLKNEKGCDLCGIVGHTPSRTKLSPVSPGVPEQTPGPGGTAAASGVAVGDAPGDLDERRGSDTFTGHPAGDKPRVFGHSPGDSARSELTLSPDTSSLTGEGGQEGGGDLQANVPSVGGVERRGNDVNGRSLNSTAVRRRPFRRSTAFFVGHRNRLGDEALDVCDFLVHVEQQTSEFPMELGAPVTTSIALHHFTAWANYKERQFTGEKFNVDREAARCRPPAREDNPVSEGRRRLREERREADPLEGPSEGAGGADGVAGLGWLAGVGGDDSTGQCDY